MICGTFTTKSVPPGELAQVMQSFQDNDPKPNSVTASPDDVGSFTVVATFPPCPAGTMHSTQSTATITSADSTSTSTSTTSITTSGQAVLATSPVTPTTDIAWGKIVGTDFKARVIEICSTLGCDPNYLMASMAFESGETFSPSIRNKISGATGLIQFMPATAVGLGTSIASLASMSAVQQLDWVMKYFNPYKNKMKSLSDVYMAILWPKAVGLLDSTILFSLGSEEYVENKGLDVNDDGNVTKGEAASKVQAKLDRGLSAQFLG